MGCSAPCAPSPPPAVPHLRPHPEPTTTRSSPTPLSDDSGPAEEIEDALVDGDRTFAPGSARAALRHKVFRRVFAGAFLSNIGTWMQNVVLGALAYDLTESPTFVGVILFAQLGPLLLFSVVGGALADTVDRKRLLVSVALSQLVLSFVLAAVAAPERPNQVALVVVVFAIGVGQALFNPAYSAMLPQLVGHDDLPGAIALHSAQMNGSRVIGPVIGALLDSMVGASAVFAFNGLTYLFVVASLLSVHLPAPVVYASAKRGWHRLSAGIDVARRDVVVRRCLVTIVTFSLVALTFVGQFPVVAERNLGIDERSAAYGAALRVLRGRRRGRRAVDRHGVQPAVEGADRAGVAARLRGGAHRLRPRADGGRRLPGRAGRRPHVLRLHHLAVDRAPAEPRRPRARRRDRAVDHGLRRHGADRQPAGRPHHRGDVDDRGHAGRRRSARWRWCRTPDSTRPQPDAEALPGHCDLHAA